MKRQSTLLLAFSLAFALLILTPSLMRFPLPFFPLLELGDVTDILTPFVIVPLGWMLFRNSSRSPVGRRMTIVFLLFAVVWVQGQGIHLAANSIGHLLKDSPGTDGYALTHFFDEVLGHYLWHTGIVGMSGLLIWRHWHPSFDAIRTPDIAVAGLGGAIYGATFFIITVEAATVQLGLPFAAIALLTVLAKARGRLARQPVLCFFATAYAITILLLIVWGLIWGGFPEFSEVGLID